MVLSDMLEARREQRKYALGLGILVLFLVSGVKSCSDVKYAVLGERTEGQVRRAFEDEGDIVVDFYFEDVDGTGHKGKDRMKPAKWQRVEAETLDVIYLSSRPERAQLAVARSLVFPIVFVVMFLAGAGWCFYAYREASKGRLV